ncbi:Atxe2 family lasso peptide isopeptidase [Sphingomonas sinipercae]|uniref:Atxe2 family lasso peptide isopeptidase n=1 Tax=Sphingomonas sinipercae TaxID=2714944 RepID=A0A6G7ZK68_9SPHN|nr:Atxe2 family lasso peptide isopeptidase [Sphingomonas sinipercae]QIL01371.1 Atxe2 family lasso peptide isopeptidase [Sphingomonas sinipercae]
MKPRRARLRLALLAVAAAASASGANATITARQLVEMASISGPAISPDGQWVAFRIDRPDVGTNTVQLDWYVAPMRSSGQPRRVASGGRAIWSGAGVLVSEKPQWSPNSASFYFRRLDPGGGVQVWRADLAQGRAVKITNDPADVTRFALGGTGQSLVYEVDGADRAEIIAAEEREYASGIHIDKAIDVAQGLYRAAEINGRLASERLHGAWFGRTNVLGDRPPRVRRIALNSAKAVGQAVPGPFEAAQAPADPQDHDLATSESGAIAFLRGWGAASELRWAASRAAAEKSVACADPACAKATALSWRPGTPEVIFSSVGGDRVQGLFAWDTERNRVRPIFKAATLTNEDREGCAIGRDSAACVISSGSEAPRLEKVDLSTGSSTRLFDPNRALTSSLTVRARWVSWKLADGRTAWGQYLAPAASKPLPLLINYYDCTGFLKGGTGDQWPFHLFAQDGIAVLCIQPLPGGGNNVEEYKTGLAATRAAIRHLAGTGLIDPARVGMSGLSFGSEVAVWTAMKSDLLAAVSIASPTLDPATYFYFNALPGRDFPQMIESSWGLKDPEKAPEGWKEISAAMNVEKMDAPLLIQTPEQEYRYNMRLYTRMLNGGRAADMYVFPHERHIVAQPQHRLAIYDRNVDWFRFWLQGFEDPSPTKAEQYRRWRSLRQSHCRTVQRKLSFC